MRKYVQEGKDQNVIEWNAILIASEASLRSLYRPVEAGPMVHKLHRSLSFSAQHICGWYNARIPKFLLKKTF